MNPAMNRGGGRASARGLERLPETGAPESRRSLLCRRIHEFIHEDRSGNAIVEMAFVAPIMMVILTGMASFAMALYAFQQLGYATSAAAQQVGAEAGVTLTDPCARLSTLITAALPGWNSANFTYTIVITDGNGVAHTYGPTTGSSFSCTAGAGNMTLNQPMAVTVSYNYNWFPILRWRPNDTFVPSGPLTVSEAVLVE